MESESLVMVRCPECGGLMVEGKECRVCAGAAVPADGTYGPPVAVTEPAPRKGRFPVVALVVAFLVVLLLVIGAAAVVFAKERGPTIDGWHTVEGRGVTLLLPEGWVGGEPGGEVLDQVLMAMRSYGASYEALAGALEANPGAVALFAVDQSAGVEGFATNVNAVAEKAPKGTTLEGYLDSALGMMPASFRIEESGLRNVGPHEGARLLTRFELPMGKGQQAAYIIKDGSVFWIVTYTTSVEEFAARLYDFERSAASIRLK